MVDGTDTRAIGDRLAALVEGDVGLVEQVYAEDGVIWHNTDELELTRPQIVAQGEAMASISTCAVEIKKHLPTPEGFVQVQRNTFTFADGASTSFESALVVTVDDAGLISRMDGFVDSAALAPLASRLG